MSAHDGLDVSRDAPAVLAMLARVGRDHDLRRDEFAPAAANDDDGALAALWTLYERHWRRFCGTQLDPQGWRLTHPARQTGHLRAERGATVVVVGTGPSLGAQIETLARHRNRLHLLTSLRGATALSEAGLTADLVLVEHQSAVDAQFSVNDLAHRRQRGLDADSWVAADARTPAALLRGVASERLYIPDPMPTVGLWPATAIAIGILAGAGTVALLGVDLGRAGAPDPLHAPLRDLLAWMAAYTDVRCVDLGVGGAEKPHWRPSTFDDLALDGAVPPLVLDARPWSTPSERHADLSAALARLAPFVQEASATLTAALAVRDRQSSSDACSALTHGVERLLAASTSRTRRIDVQDALGVTFLPRLWRTPPCPSLGASLWRPAALACHEIVQQHHALQRGVERAA